MPDISIIVPIFNTSRFLKKCINSLVNQTHENIEIILINDGSTDKSEEIIRKFKDNRIKYYKHKNQGIGKSRNFGLSKATGKYVLFVDSDDYLELNACELLYLKAEKCNLDVLIFDIYNVIKGNPAAEKTNSIKNTTLKKNPKILENINLSVCNKLFLRELITTNKIKFQEENRYLDIPFLIESLIKSKKIGKVDEPLYYYLIHDSHEYDVNDIFKTFNKILKIGTKEKYLLDQIKRTIVKYLTYLNLEQRKNRNKNMRNKFIDDSFEYLKNNVPEYKNKKYYINEGIIKRTIMKSKKLTKAYCTVIK